MACRHTFARGANAGKSCINNGIHNGYCNKHRKLVVPQEAIDAVGQAPPAAKPAPKSRFSAFNWTLNTNTSAAKMTPHDIAEFKRLIAHVFAPANVVEYLHDANAPDPATNIIKLESVYHFEIAPKTTAVHAHGAVRLEHVGHYRLMLENIRAVVEGVRGKGIHFSVQPSGNAEAAWDRYMAKNAAADPL